MKSYKPIGSRHLAYSKKLNAFKSFECRVFGIKCEPAPFCRALLSLQRSNDIRILDKMSQDPYVSEMEIRIVQHDSLRFRYEDNITNRRSSSSIARVHDHPEVVSVVAETACLVDKKYHPILLTIHLEFEAEAETSELRETIPLSLVFSQQIPPENSIRLGMLEMKDDPIALRSILAHEMGHLIVEWVARTHGVAKASDYVIPFWSKPIYEGVADFAAACVTRSTLIGSEKCWFHRDILTYTTLEDARDPSLDMGEQLERGFRTLGLIPKYDSYARWVDFIRSSFKRQGIRDPYSEGTWLAGQLWELSKNGLAGPKVWDAITRLTASGEAFHEPNFFLSRIAQLTA